MLRLRSCASFAIFILSAAFFALLQTRQYLAVDGATRCVFIYWHRTPVLGRNNHLLYFVNVYIWTHILSLAAIRATNVFIFIHLAQWMNALAAAGCVSLLFVLCRSASNSASAGLASSLMYPFSNAFLLHATSSAEPVVGLFWSILSISAVASGLATSSPLRLFVGGALLALAMGTYESMVLIGPAEVLLILYWDELDITSNRALLVRFLAGCILGGIAVYVPAYAISGTTNPASMLRRFLRTGGGQQIFGGFRLSRLINLPIGFANSVVATVPTGYHGIRWLFRTYRFDSTTISILMILLTAGVWTAWTVHRVMLVWDSLRRRQQLILKCCAVALAFDLAALLYWDPIYDKLWLQPLAVVFLAWSIMFATWRRLLRPRLMLIPEALLLIVILGTGFARALRAHQSPTPCLDGAGDVAAVLQPGDLLVSGWDPVSVLYNAFYDRQVTQFDLISIASNNGPNTMRILGDAIAGTRARGGRVYFLGLLDMPKYRWKPFVGDRVHLSYRSLDQIRECANPVAKLLCASGHEETLWRLPRHCSKR